MVKCCFCGKDAGKFGNNAQPVMNGRCCDDCNNGVVIPIRILQAQKSPLLQLKKLATQYLNKRSENVKP